MEKANIKSEFKKRRIRQYMVLILLVPVLFIMIHTERHPTEELFGYPIIYTTLTGLVLIIGGLIFSLFNWLCPNCNKYLGKRINPNFCSHCGSELR